ncbi:coenzyme F420-0:L-glutamate ligase [Chelatococcus reniformis]|nr:coenzyme F420-0:L-glutamate ligase [Chelatococcus reniformis]
MRDSQLPSERRTGVRMELLAPTGFPLVEAGQPIAPLILATLAADKLALRDGDVVVLAQKIVSKAENRYVELASVEPSAQARDLAGVCGKDPRLVEIILAESTAVVRCRPGVIIVRHRLGLVLANAGIDHSNIPGSAGGDRVLLLPRDPDASAAALRHDLAVATGADVAVVIIDSLGRAWRLGTCGACIGAAGLTTVADLRGRPDLFGQTLVSTVVGTGDEIAAAASLVMGQAAEGLPLVIVRGLPVAAAARGTAADLVRPLAEDLFT